METSYKVELKHQNDAAESSDKEIGKKVHMSTDWLCAWFGSEHLCMNVSRWVGDWGAFEVHAKLSHSFHLLNAGTGNYQFICFTHSVLP